MEDQFLNVEQINMLLNSGDKLQDKVERSLYTTPGGGLIAVSNSKLYDDDTFWYSCTVDYFKEKGADRICFVAGKLGIILLPISALSNYIKHCGWKQQRKGRSYYIRIKLRDGAYSLFSSEDKDLNVTNYFIPTE